MFTMYDNVCTLKHSETPFELRERVQRERTRAISAENHECFTGLAYNLDTVLTKYATIYRYESKITGARVDK